MGPTVDIDLRAELFPPRDQGMRPTCLAIAATAAHEYARRMGSRLCAEYLYFIASGEGTGTLVSKGLTMTAVRFAMRERGQPFDSVWPYDPDGPTPSNPPVNVSPLLRCILNSHQSPDAVITFIRRSVPVVLALEITHRWYADLAPSYVIDESPGYSGRGSSVGHAVLVIGLREDDVGNPLLLVQNSWGVHWGSNGFAWLSWDYVRHHFLECMTVGQTL